MLESAFLVGKLPTFLWENCRRFWHWRAWHKMCLADYMQSISLSHAPATRANLHVVLCLSPVGEAFRERCRMFPGLVNCTTIDWFLEWPADALYEVAARRLSEDTALPAIVGPAAAEAVRAAACRVLVGVHQSVEDTARRMWAALRRRVYVTPTNYLECVHNYAALLGEKRAKLAGKAGKLQGGLLKLDETRTQVRGAQACWRWARWGLWPAAFLGSTAFDTDFSPSRALPPTCRFQRCR